MIGRVALRASTRTDDGQERLQGAPIILVMAPTRELAPGSYIYIYIYICYVYVCMCVYIYIYIYICTSRLERLDARPRPWTAIATRVVSRDRGLFVCSLPG